jgi:hypothetical protein
MAHIEAQREPYRHNDQSEADGGYLSQERLGARTHIPRGHAFVADGQITPSRQGIHPVGHRLGNPLRNGLPRTHLGRGLV